MVGLTLVLVEAVCREEGQVTGIITVGRPTAFSSWHDHVARGIVNRSAHTPSAIQLDVWNATIAPTRTLLRSRRSHIMSTGKARKPGPCPSRCTGPGALDPKWPGGPSMTGSISLSPASKPSPSKSTLPVAQAVARADTRRRRDRYALARQPRAPPARSAPSAPARLAPPTWTSRKILGSPPQRMHQLASCGSRRIL